MLDGRPSDGGAGSVSLTVSKRGGAWARTPVASESNAAQGTRDGNMISASWMDVAGLESDDKLLVCPWSVRGQTAPKSHGAVRRQPPSAGCPLVLRRSCQSAKSIMRIEKRKKCDGSEGAKNVTGRGGRPWTPRRRPPSACGPGPPPDTVVVWTRCRAGCRDSTIPLLRRPRS